MSQHLPTGNFQTYGKSSITESFVDKVLNTHDCSINGDELIVDVIYSDTTKEKSKNFPICLEIKVINPKNFTECMKEHVPKP